MKIDEAIKGDAAYDAYMQWANGDEENMVFAELRTVLPSLNDIQAGQVVIAVARALANLPTPSREEEPTDEQVKRAQSARIDYMTRNGQGYTSDAAMRAALKAAGPSAQQRVSEEMVERLKPLLQQVGDNIVGVFEQMLKGNWRDDHDHDVRRNVQMLELKNSLQAIMEFRAAYLDYSKPAALSPENGGA